MFTVFCDSHGTEVLLTTSRIEGLCTAADGGIEIRWRCWCGTAGRSPAGSSPVPPALAEAS